MTELFYFYFLLVIHFFSDFVFQTDKEATNKATNNKYLFIHCIKYSLLFFVCFGWIYGIVTFISHFIIDYITSKIAGWFYINDKRHLFFVTIGADQLLHYLVFLFLIIFVGIKYSLS